MVRHTTWRKLYVIILVLISSQILFAASTGKIAGVITDASTNATLLGANVIIDGTYLGAATNPNGQYSILNVPPGIHTLKVTMMGYNDLVINEVRVSIDLTTTIDAQMEPKVLEAGETVTITAEKALVQPDMTSSLATVGSDEIENLPVQSMSDVLELQAGVVRDGGDFHIRGGRAGEVSFWVDGIETTDIYSGSRMGVTIEKNAIQELQVVSGTFNAEYGKAMSGIVNIITKEGGKKYFGEVTTYVGDYVTTSDNNIYNVISRVDTVRNTTTGLIDEVERSENPLAKFNPLYNADFTFGGPMPVFGDKVSFFLNGRYVSNTGYLYGRNWYTPQGLPGDSSLVPMTSGYNYSGLGKLTFRLSPNLKLNYQLMLNHSHNDRGYNRNYRYVPYGVSQGNSDGMTHLISLTHTLSKNTFYELRFSRMDRESESYLYEDPTAMPHYFVNVLDANGNIIETFDPVTNAGMQRLEEVKQSDAPYEFFVDPDDPEGYTHPDSARAPGGMSYSFYNQGTQNGHNFRTYGFWTTKFDITSQMNPVHQVKAGVEFKIHELGLDNYSMIPGLTENGSDQIIPYTPTVPGISSLSRDKYDRSPRELSAYIQDKLELNDMIVNIGLRFDYFDANTTMPVDPKDVDVYYPFLKSNIYKNWVEPDEPLTPAEMTAYEASFEEYTPEERMAFMHEDVKAKMQVSPRLGIAYPITDKGIIHFSYGHFFGMPAMSYLYNNANFKLQRGGGNSLIGNPDLAAEKTVQYELGLQQQLGEDIGLDVTVFYRDTRDWVGSSPLKETYSPAVSYSEYENKDYANVRGITLNLEKRFANRFSTNVFYSFSIAEGSYSDPADAYSSILADQEPRLALIPMGWDQRHTLNAYLMFDIKGYTITFTGKYQTGRPYTPSYPKAEAVGGATYVGWATNSARLPSTSQVDLRVQKRIRVSGMNLKVFAVVYNLLDQRGETNVYSETGSAAYSADVFSDYQSIGYNPLRVGSYNDWIRQPSWYQAPRQVQLGLAVGF